MTTSGRLILPLAEPVLNSAGEPASGSTLTVYVAGGSTLAGLYADAALSTPILNPQTADAAGRFDAQSTVIWADASQAYDCVLVISGGGGSLTFPSIYLLGAATNTSGFAPINSPTFTGVPTAPTPGLSDNSQKLATTGYVQGQGYAPINAPTFTGVPAAPTAASGTNTTQLATTAFVHAAVEGFTASFGSAGYVEIPFPAGTLIINWGTFSCTSAGQTVAFSQNFPNAFLGGQMTMNTVQDVGGLAITSPTLTNMVCKAYGSSTYPGYWIAWGY